uniref:Uncharacterized protein n=1 Tax=Anguilla anguilla TaxID=7936 RepID=A0A0E9RY11_ANGAN
MTKTQRQFSLQSVGNLTTRCTCGITDLSDLYRSG